MPIASGIFARVSNSFSAPSVGSVIDPTTADALFDDYDLALDTMLSLRSRVATQFDKTADTTLANVTGLTATVGAGLTYAFEAVLYTTSNTSGGVKFAIAGTATATTIVYECLTIEGTSISAHTRASALAGAVGGVTAGAAAYAVIKGTIIVNAGGTLTVQFAQNASNGAASSVLVGSSFIVNKIT
jgi:hypothetical protein